MAILVPDLDEKPRIDLAGPQGNAFALLALAEDLGKRLRFPDEKIKQVKEQMMSGDYDNLIQVFDDHFGEVVDLVLPVPNEDHAPSPPAARTRSPGR